MGGRCCHIPSAGKKVLPLLGCLLTLVDGEGFAWLTGRENKKLIEGWSVGVDCGACCDQLLDSLNSQVFSFFKLVICNLEVQAVSVLPRAAAPLGGCGGVGFRLSLQQRVKLLAGIRS